VEPLFNRTILFEVADQIFHGVRPVKREEMERNSFAIYFHTVGLPNGKTATPHNSIYALCADFLPEPARDQAYFARLYSSYIAARGSKNSWQVGNQRRVKYHHYSQIPAKYIPSSNRVAH